MSRIQSRMPAGGVCAVNREDFEKSYLDVPKITVLSPAELKSKIDQAIGILSKSTEDWSKRMNQLKLIRSMIIHGENNVERGPLLTQIMRLTDALELSVKDLRSQILREAAITCSFIVEKFGNDAHQIGETILPAAMAQVSVSTKVMATAGATLAGFIVQYIQTKQIFAIVTSYATSKDKGQRRQLMSLLETIITNWNDKIKKPVLRSISELIKSAICDADSETRTAGRKAFSKLDELHSEDADRLFQTLDASKQKMLRGTTGADASSSSTSVNSERGSLLMKSKLGPRAPSNISAKFLAQRSASAIDTKQLVRPMTAVSGTPGSKLTARPGVARTMSKIDTSPGGSKFARPQFGMGPRTNSNLRARTPLTTSQPGSRNASPPRRSSTASNLPPEMQRVKSNLGSGSFIASLTQEQAESLQKKMNDARDQLRQPSRTDDDEFLLVKRPVVKTPQKSPLDVSRVDQVLRACSSSSANEKKEGIKMLSSIVIDPTLSDIEVRNIGATVNRLLGDASNQMVLESVTAFVQTHHARLRDWLKVGLLKLVSKKGSEAMSGNRKLVGNTLDAVLTSFDSQLQLKSTCELMCDPINLLPPKARIALLEYLNELLSKHMERGTPFYTEEVKKTIMKMFSWMSDQRNGQMVLPHAEKVLCALFGLNAADFSALFSDFNADYRDWAYRILQVHGHDEHQAGHRKNVEEEEKCVRANIFNTAAQIEDYVTQRTGSVLGDLTDSPLVQNNQQQKPSGSPSPRYSNSPHQKLSSFGPLRPLNSSMNVDDDLNLNESFDRLKLNSTTHLVEDTVEQNKYVHTKIEQMKNYASPAEQNEGMAALHTMLCEGSFTLWEQNFPKLLLAVFDVLAKSESDANKKLALRVLSKMCTSQAARLFDSTEMAVCRVIDATVSSKDGTITVSADDCLKTLATHLPLAKIVNVAKAILNSKPKEDSRASLVLKMTTKLFEELAADELAPIVDDMAPCAIEASDSQSSTVRKSAVYCLVAMVNKLGQKSMEKHLQSLTSNKKNIIQVYVSRAMSSSAHSHV